MKGLGFVAAGWNAVTGGPTPRADQANQASQTTSHRSTTPAEGVSASSAPPPQTWREPVKLLKTFSLAAVLATAALAPANAVDISGAGATFPYPIYAKWADAYK